jgi:hypothetical protein
MTGFLIMIIFPLLSISSLSGRTLFASVMMTDLEYALVGNPAFFENIVVLFLSMFAAYGARKYYYSHRRNK